MVGMDCYWFDLLHLKMAFWTSDWTASASLSCISTLLHVGGLDMTEVLVTGIDGRVFIPIGSCRVIGSMRQFGWMYIYWSRTGGRGS